MNLKEIIALQIDLDERHGFPVHFRSSQDKYNQINKDLVGLFGEIGEFSNIVKKINIKIERSREYDFDIGAAEAHLREELIDTLIYLVRLSAILNIDIEDELLAKIRFNESRYASLRQE